MLGAVDDVWQFGKPRGVGGPWLASSVEANQPSDPYLMTGFDRKTVRLSHDAKEPVVFKLECDVTGTGLWLTFREFNVPAGEVVTAEFPDAYAAYWLRVTAGSGCKATCQLKYE